MPDAKLWTQRDRFGNEIYLTRERWTHIVSHHPEVEPFIGHVAETIHAGRRRQDRYDPNSYQYFRAYDNLPNVNNHVVVSVRFRWRTDVDGTVYEEKFVTMYLQSFEE